MNAANTKDLHYKQTLSDLMGSQYRKLALKRTYDLPFFCVLFLCHRGFCAV